MAPLLFGLVTCFAGAGVRRFDASAFERRPWNEPRTEPLSSELLPWIAASHQGLAPDLLGLTLAGTYATGSAPYGVVVDPTGKFAYTADAGSNTLSAFTINATTRALTPVSGSPFTVSSGAQALAVDPSGRYLYTANISNGNVGAFGKSTWPISAV